MKVRNCSRIVVMVCCVLVIAGASLSHATNRGRGSQGRKIRWFAHLYPQNPAFIEVVVDLTNLPRNLVVTTASFQVEFYRADGQPIHTQSFNFLDQNVVALEPDKYRRYYKHRCPEARSARGIAFKGFADSEGHTFDIAPAIEEEGLEWSPESDREWMLMPDRLPYTDVTIGIENATNRPGGDYQDFELPKADPDLCRIECRLDARCKAYTYAKPGLHGDKAHCWLKSPAPAPVHEDCCVSGMKNTVNR